MPFAYEQRRLENNLVALDVFDLAAHAQPFVDLVQAHPDTFTYVGFPGSNSVEDFLRDLYNPLHESAGGCLFAIVDKTVSPADAESGKNLAGVVSVRAPSKKNATAELGILVFPPFQRTHVARNAVGLVLLWTLDPPAAGGLGLRRVEWRTHAANAPSCKIAERLGLELEGILRWERAYPRLGPFGLSVEALEKRNGTTGEAPGGHTAVYSLVWDEWDDKRPAVVALLDRKQEATQENPRHLEN